MNDMTRQLIRRKIGAGLFALPWIAYMEWVRVRSFPENIPRETNEYIEDQGGGTA